MDALIIVDMQNDILQGPSKLDLDAVVQRINRLAERVRRRGGTVIFVQHDGSEEAGFLPFSDGWEILSTIRVEPKDRFVRKTLHDAFWETSLRADLETLRIDRVLVVGWATDFCVNATVRTASACGFKVVVGADCHTCADRPRLSAREVIDYHHWIWANLISPQEVEIIPEAEL